MASEVAELHQATQSVLEQLDALRGTISERGRSMEELFELRGRGIEKALDDIGNTLANIHTVLQAIAQSQPLRAQSNAVSVSPTDG